MTAWAMSDENRDAPLTVCLRFTIRSLRNAKLSQTKTRWPAQNDIGNERSTEFRIPTASATLPSGVSGVVRSRVPNCAEFPIMRRLDDSAGKNAAGTRVGGLHNLAPIPGVDGSVDLPNSA